MSIFKDVVEIDVSDFEVLKWQRKQAEKGVKRDRMIKAIGDVFEKIEDQDKTCAWICMNADNYFTLRAYLNEGDWDQYTKKDILLTGRFGRIWTAIIVVNKNVKEPIGYGADDLPDGLVRKLPEGIKLG